MPRFMTSVLYQQWFPSPVGMWSSGKPRSYLAEAENYRQAADILVRFALSLNSADLLVSGQRCVAGWVVENPAESWIERVKPEILADPMPGMRLIETRHLYGYIITDGEGRLRPDVPLSGPFTRPVLLCNLDSGEAAFVSELDGHLYRSSGGAKKYAIRPAYLSNITAAFNYNMLMPVPGDPGGIDWSRSVPDISGIPLLLEWFREQEETK